MNSIIVEIQLIRGFFIFIVVVGHMTGNLITWSAPGSDAFYHYFDGTAALDLFFVLSGFVICRLLLVDLGKTNSQQVAIIFWVRRIWRLLPAAWLWLVLILLLTKFFNTSGAFGGFRDAWAGALSAFLQVANFKLLDCFDEGFYCGPSFPYWTLSLEEQFYLFLPLFMIFSKRWFVPAVFIILFTQMFVPALMMPPTVRLHGLLLGILLAVWSTRPSYKIFEPTFMSNKWVSRIFLGSLIALLCVSGSRVLPEYVIYQLGSIIGLIIIYLTTWNAGYLFADKSLYKLGLWLGDRAYVMYLNHIPVMYMTREIFYRVLGPDVKLGPEHLWPLVGSSLVLILLLSDLTFRFVERPLRRKGVRISKEMAQKQAEG
jgi:peptidoglycan/LPS O-acetylase OafA/YrhL